jgi:hypothetical protein
MRSKTHPATHDFLLVRRRKSACPSDRWMHFPSQKGQQSRNSRGSRTTLSQRSIRRPVHSRCYPTNDALPRWRRARFSRGKGLDHGTALNSTKGSQPAACRCPARGSPARIFVLFGRTLYLRSNFRTESIETHRKFYSLDPMLSIADAGFVLFSECTGFRRASCIRNDTRICRVHPRREICLTRYRFYRMISRGAKRPPSVFVNVFGIRPGTSLIKLQPPYTTRDA